MSSLSTNDHSTANGEITSESEEIEEDEEEECDYSKLVFGMMPDLLAELLFE